jgi:hypothetical protein
MISGPPSNQIVVAAKRAAPPELLNCRVMVGCTIGALPHRNHAASARPEPAVDGDVNRPGREEVLKVWLHAREYAHTATNPCLAPVVH